MDENTKDITGIYRKFLLETLTTIYKARKQTERTDWKLFSDLLIDKFANQSSTLYFLLTGFIESNKSTIIKPLFGFDVFSINSLIRVLIETFATFNHIFVNPKTEEEMHLHFLLWKLDGLLDKKKFKIESTDFDEVPFILEKDKNILSDLRLQIDTNSFYKALPEKEAIKILNGKNVFWKFIILPENLVRVLNITELIHSIIPERMFLNVYKYTSMHSHSGYLSLEHFEKIRGKVLSTEHVNTYIKTAIDLTIFIIYDMRALQNTPVFNFLYF